MLTFEFDNHDALVAAHPDFEHSPSEIKRVRAAKNVLIDRNDIRNMSHAEHIASRATELTGHVHIAIDRSESVYPRFDVIRCPALGDKVSYSFNGDCYPDGEITNISPTLKVITTSTGSRYYRRGQTGSWVKAGTWCLINGHHSKRNPCF